MRTVRITVLFRDEWILINNLEIAGDFKTKAWKVTRKICLKAEDETHKTPNIAQTRSSKVEGSRKQKRNHSTTTTIILAHKTFFSFVFLQFGTSV